MSQLERRLDALEALSGIHGPEVVREYSDPATGETTRVYLQGGCVVRVEAIDRAGRSLPASRLWEGL